MSMDKLLEVPAFDEFGKPNTRIIPRMSASVFEKTAGSLPAEVKDYLERLEPDPQFLYLLVVALGAADFWGSNVNGDAFFEKDLLGIQTPMEAGRNPTPYSGVPLPRYKTFLSAHIFKHHVNKDPENSFGKVDLPIYDKDMHRVLLILAVNKQKAPDIVNDIDKNGSVVWSMGTKVPWDECSVCHQRSKKVDEYCEHLKTAMNDTWSNGHKVYAINTMPRFFDISRVLIPADRTAMTLMKVASAHTSSKAPLRDDDTGCGAYSFGHRSVPSAIIAERVKVAQAKMAAEKKEGEITKHVPAVTVSKDLSDDADRAKIKQLKGLGDRAHLISKTEKDLARETLEKLSAFPLHQILSSMAGCGMIAKVGEFTRIVAIKMQHGESVKDMMPIVDEGAIKTAAVELLLPFMAERSALAPWITIRDSDLKNRPMIKMAGIPSNVTIVTLYDQYRQSLMNWDEAISRRTIVKHAHLLAEGRTASSEEMFHAMTKTSGAVHRAALAGAGLFAPYVYSAHLQRSGKEKNVAQRFAEKHPGVLGTVGALGAYAGARRFV